MPANFTSGWLGNGERAWHGLGVVEEGTRPARQAFELANALFGVEKRPSYILTKANAWVETGKFAIVRTDNEVQLGHVSDKYEIVPNDSLLRMAEFIREEADMDSVVVLNDGAKVCFTATLKGAAQDIVQGDTVKKRIVGYLGHDGLTGCGALYTTIRVVCTNTFAAAVNQSRKHVSIRHASGANANFDALIKSIDCARESFAQECELFREFAQYQFTMADFNQYVSDVYDADQADLADGKFRKQTKLLRAYRGGLGARDFAPYTLWSAVNAVTEVETSTKTGTLKQRQSKFKSANFGQGLQYSRKAIEVAKELVCA